MRIAEFSVRRWRFTVVIFVMLAALGVASWRSIPRAEDPSFPIPIYTVVAVLPGATPVDLERLVVKPIEDKVTELERLKEIDARVGDGLAVIQVEFDAGVDAERKYDEVVREVNALRASMPAELTTLEINKTTSLNVSILQLALVSELAPYRTMDSLAQDVEERIERVPGIRRAERWAAPGREVRVLLDLGRLAELGLPPGAVLAAIQGESADVPGGSLDAGGRRFNVKTSGSYESLDQVAGTVVASSGGTLVRVADVAQVQWADAEPTHVGRYNGRRAVFVTAQLQDGQVIGDVRDAVWRELDAFEQSLPAGITLERPFDQAANVSHRLTRLGEDFAIAIGLVLVTLIPLGFRASGIVLVSIPLSLAMGVALLHALGYSINQLSIVGFVIALGLLVDDSIVVVENIARHLREGYSAHGRGDPRHEADRGGGAGLHGDADLRLPAAAGAAGPVGPLHPLAAGDGGGDGAGVAVRVAHDHPVAGEPAAAGRRGRATATGCCGWLTHGIERTYAPVLQLGAGAPAADDARRGGPGGGEPGAGAGGRVLALPQGGDAAVPGGHPHARRLEPRGNRPGGALRRAGDRVARGRARRLHQRGARQPADVLQRAAAQREPGGGAVVRAVGGVRPGHDAGAAGQHAGGARRVSGRAHRAARVRERAADRCADRVAPSGPDLDTLRALASRAEALLERDARHASTSYNPVRLRRTDLALPLDRGRAGLLGVSTARFRPHRAARRRGVAGGHAARGQRRRA